MKTLTNALFIFTVLTHSSDILALSRDDERALDEVLALETAGDLKRSSLVAAGYAIERYESVGFDKEVAAVTTELLKKNREVITEETRAGGKLSFFGIFSIKGGFHYDAAKIVNTNPREVARFSSMQERDFAKLQNKIRKLTVKHQDDLLFAKVMAAKSLELANKVEIVELQEIYPVISRVAQKMMNVSFLGIQNVLSCTNTQYADRSKGAKLKVRFLFFKLNLAGEQNQNAHTEKVCSTQELQAKMDSFVDSSSALQSADESLRFYERAVSTRLFTDVEAEYYPSWGSTYFDEESLH